MRNIRRSGENILADISIMSGPSAASGAQVAGGAADFGALSRQVGQAMGMAPIAAIDLSRLEQFEEQFATAKPEDLAKLWEQQKSAIDPSAPPVEATIIGELLLVDWAAKDGLPAA